MKQETEAKLLGRYIVTDPKICHGKPTFRGTRIFVSDVLEMVAEGVVWETIIRRDVTTAGIQPTSDLLHDRLLRQEP
jgi:uncharacterized protein (DUF433 family)